MQVTLLLQHLRMSLRELLQHSSRTVDLHLADYIDHLHAAQGSYSYACQAANGLVFYCPRLRGRLHESQQRLRGWKKLAPSVAHPPITLELTALLSVTLAKQGLHAEAVGCLLAFDCLLRVSELTNIRYSDAALPLDARFGSSHVRMAVRLASTKTGANQSVALTEPAVEQVLLHYLSVRSWAAADFIFPFSPARFRRALARVAADCGLDALQLVPHSFRHGGATRAALMGDSVESIMLRGRWKALESVKNYLQMARARLLLQQIPAAAAQLGTVLLRTLVPCMRLLLPAAAAAPVSEAVQPAARRSAPTQRVRFA